MNKTVYASIVKDILEQDGYEVILTPDTKNNSACISLTIKNDTNVSPVFNVGDNEEIEPEEFAEFIKKHATDSLDENIIRDVVCNKDEFLKRSIYILVNRELNSKRQSIVRVPVCNTLEKHFKLDVSDIIKNACISLNEIHLKQLGIGVDELDSAASNNMKKTMPAVIKNIGEFIPMLGHESDLFVLTNSDSIYGAGAVLYEGIQEKIERKVGEDFLLLPSSIHEWIIVPHEYGDIEVMTNIIQEINSTTIKPEELLSDRPYILNDNKLVEA